MTMTVNLGDALERSVEEMIAKGRYGSRSEVLREGVRLVEEREQQIAKLRRDMEEALQLANAPGGTVPIEEAYARSKARLAAKISEATEPA